VFQRWVQGPNNTQAPLGVAEPGITNRSVAPSGLTNLGNAKPSVETLGYSRMSLRDGGLAAQARQIRICKSQEQSRKSHRDKSLLNSRKALGLGIPARPPRGPSTLNPIETLPGSTRGLGPRPDILVARPEAVG
jgi:hypothetical protein